MGQALAAKMTTGSAQGAGGGGSSEGPQNPETAWWCRLLARIVGTVGAIVAFVLGIFTCVTVSPLCIISGLLLMLSAVIVLVFEAPICCTFIDATKPIAAFAERRTYFQKAIIYVLLCIAPLAMCFDLSTAFGCGPIFAAGVIYGIMGLGKKGDRDQMAAAADTIDRPRDLSRPDDTRVGLIENEDAQSPFQGGQGYRK